MVENCGCHHDVSWPCKLYLGESIYRQQGPNLACTHSIMRKVHMSCNGILRAVFDLPTGNSLQEQDFSVLQVPKLISFEIWQHLSKIQSLPTMPLVESFTWHGKEMSAQAQSMLSAKSALTSLNLRPNIDDSLQPAFILKLASALTELRQLHLDNLVMSIHILDRFTSLKRYILCRDSTKFRTGLPVHIHVNKPECVCTSKHDHADSSRKHNISLLQPYNKRMTMWSLWLLWRPDGCEWILGSVSRNTIFRFMQWVLSLEQWPLCDDWLLHWVCAPVASCVN